MKQTNFNRFRGSQSKQVKQLLAAIFGGGHESHRGRDDMPEWLVNELIEKAKRKREDRSRKLMSAVASGGMMMYEPPKAKKKRGKIRSIFNKTAEEK